MLDASGSWLSTLVHEHSDARRATSGRSVDPLLLPGGWAKSSRPGRVLRGRRRDREYSFRVCVGFRQSVQAPEYPFLARAYTRAQRGHNWAGDVLKGGQGDDDGLMREVMRRRVCRSSTGAPPNLEKKISCQNRERTTNGFFTTHSGRKRFPGITNFSTAFHVNKSFRLFFRLSWHLIVPVVPPRPRASSKGSAGFSLVFVRTARCVGRRCRRWGRLGACRLCRKRR